MRAERSAVGRPAPDGQLTVDGLGEGGQLVGPWPESADLWHERSPINHVDRIRAPVIVLQGLEDKVVPPSQSELVVAALARKGIPHAYIGFEGEQHGFRKAENIKRAIEAELSFYGQVFGFEPADDIEPVQLRGR